MDSVDLNLLTALDALLAEGSVTAAARRLGLSSSAMSRTLARLRATTGDPLLVRAGRRLVPTPRAAALRDQVHALAHDVRTVLSPRHGRLDVAALARTFTIRASEGFVELFSVPLVAAVTDAAPRACLRFAPKPDKDAGPLREAQIDLEVGVLGASAPEVRTQVIFRDSFVGAVRAGHPLLAGAVTPERYAACQHVVASRKASFRGPVDEALEAQGLHRAIVAVMPGYRDALRIARQSDLVALVPRACLGKDMTRADPPPDGLASFELPVRTPEIVVSAMWHPRLDADPAHQWLRGTLMAVCRNIVSAQRRSADQGRSASGPP
ncbi:LysR family transcriptional regulator [Pseudoroseomonas wenyumeiae]|uniref:LysR family transcriptional regulator n=1 Tax=Teichococcus wenyumeiae TaxID=2478470 RepID=A0A3A9JK69_9PROT|nr:LysR family transcriptional regulator [Pseudoroseomonas wenyumeiae]RKK04084.1 LysR family transcriptional regulator [Pseudoroseomonas wenyumeiae]RMI24566.1 LysR family transcriptional regulator [Pseudoroseomonas wenyumeiae]